MLLQCQSYLQFFRKKKEKISIVDDTLSNRPLSELVKLIHCNALNNWAFLCFNFVLLKFPGIKANGCTWCVFSLVWCAFVCLSKHSDWFLHSWVILLSSAWFPAPHEWLLFSLLNSNFGRQHSKCFCHRGFYLFISF